MVVIEAHLISKLYFDEVLRYAALPFCVKTSATTRPRMTMPEHTSLESAKTMLCASTGQFPHQTYRQFNMSMTFWTEVPPHNNDIKKPPASRCSVAIDINADPSAPNQKNYSKEYTKPVLVLICL